MTVPLILSVNVTVALGTGNPWAVTVAVKVVLVPKFAVEDETVRVVAVVTYGNTSYAFEVLTVEQSPNPNTSEFPPPTGYMQVPDALFWIWK
jgi:hypothetical protein